MPRSRVVGLVLGALILVSLVGTSTASSCTPTETRTFGSLKIDVSEGKLDETTNYLTLPFTFTNTKGDKSYTLKGESFTIRSREGGKFKVLSGLSTVIIEPGGKYKTTISFGPVVGCPTTLHFEAQGLSLTTGDIPLPGTDCN